MTRNCFLSNLPPAERRRSAGYLKRVTLELGERVYNEGERVQHVFFPEGALLSMFLSGEGEHSLETVMAGREGASGLPSVLGDGVSSHEVAVQHPGAAWRMETPAFCDLFFAGGAFQRYAMRYIQYLFLMAAQSAFCSANHRIDERLARWLLMSQSGVGSATLHLTHDVLAAMLGVQRSSVTTVAVSLRQAGILRYSRGSIHILDRNRLAGRACRCYEAIQRRENALLAHCKEAESA